MLNIEQARAQFQIRRADQLPTLNVQANGLRQPSPPVNATAGRSIGSTYTAGLGITAYELDFFGRVASLKEAALAQYLATEEGRKTTQISLIALVANTYLGVLADEELIGITAQTLATRQAFLRLVKLRFEGGVTSELDYRLAESLLETSKVTQSQLQRQHALDFNTLTLLVGQALTPAPNKTGRRPETLSLCECCLVSSFSPSTYWPTGLNFPWK